MARVAVHAVIDVAVDAAVPRVGCRCGVARGAGKDGVIRGIGVAGSAHAICVAMPEREERVIAGRQRGGKPCCCCVACGAGGWPACGDVIWICGRCEVCLVARVAISGSACEDVVDVALIAGDRFMRASQRKRRVVVVECSAGPVVR